MRASVVLYLVAFALILILLFVTAQGLAVSQCLVRVVDVVGSAEIQPKGTSSWQALPLGQLIKAGDMVRTGADSEVDLAWANGTHVRLGANTAFSVAKAQTKNSTRTTSSETKLSIGKIWVRLRKGMEGTSKFEVKTPTIVAAVRGTVFSIEVAEDGTTTVETMEGLVGVTQGNRGSQVKKKSFAVYSESDEAKEPGYMTEDQLKAWIDKQSVTGAFVSVVQPKDGERIEGSLVVVSGYTDPGNMLDINGMRVQPDKQGKWSVNVALKSGENLITISALDGEGRQRTILRRVIKEGD
jgi:hypothetical protein